MLQYIFDRRTANGTTLTNQNHIFTLRDISEAYQALKIPEPASISNTILDLTRQDRGIGSRLPQSIISFGYDLRKKTGKAPNNENFAGEFVYVGLGQTLDSWLVWPEKYSKELSILNTIPAQVAPFITKDEGALFSVIDYCDVLSIALLDRANTVFRVQNPMKWQPNEIDGLYLSGTGQTLCLYPIEAKALATHDDVNMEQMWGQYETIKYKIPGVSLVPLAIQMTSQGMRIAVLNAHGDKLKLVESINVILDEPPKSWAARK